MGSLAGTSIEGHSVWKVWEGLGRFRKDPFGCQPSPTSNNLQRVLKDLDKDLIRTFSRGVKLLLKDLIRTFSKGVELLLKDLTGIIIRVYLSWNFGRLVPGVVNSHRYETRTI